MLASPAHAAHVTKAHVSPPQHKQVSLAVLAADTALMLPLYAAPLVSGRCETVVAVCKAVTRLACSTATQLVLRWISVRWHLARPDRLTASQQPHLTPAISSASPARIAVELYIVLYERLHQKFAPSPPAGEGQEAKGTDTNTDHCVGVPHGVPKTQH